MGLLAQTINAAVDDVIRNLTFMDAVVVTTNNNLQQGIDNIGWRAKAIVQTSVGAMQKTLDSVDCSLVGDSYDTIIQSVCGEGLAGFKQYAWSFVSRSVVGLLLIIATILLNLFVGLRGYQGDKRRKARELSKLKELEFAKLAKATESSPGVPTPQSKVPPVAPHNDRVGDSPKENKSGLTPPDPEAKTSMPVLEVDGSNGVSVPNPRTNNPTVTRPKENLP